MIIGSYVFKHTQSQHIPSNHSPLQIQQNKKASHPLLLDYFSHRSPKAWRSKFFLPPFWSRNKQDFAKASNNKNVFYDITHSSKLQSAEKIPTHLLSPTTYLSHMKSYNSDYKHHQRKRYKRIAGTSAENNFKVRPSLLHYTTYIYNNTKLAFSQLVVGLL